RAQHDSRPVADGRPRSSFASRLHRRGRTSVSFARGRAHSRAGRPERPRLRRWLPHQGRGPRRRAQLLRREDQRQLLRQPPAVGLPTIQGTIVLADAANGTPLAIMDSGSVTALRTGAATAVAATFLARPDARTATIVGCGVQGELQLAAITAVLPLRHIMLVDLD